MKLRIYHFIIDTIALLASTVDAIEKRDRDLGAQMRRAMASIALNTAEATQSAGRNASLRFYSAAGSARETQACIDVAVALRYIERLADNINDRLDRIQRTLSRLTRR